MQLSIAQTALPIQLNITLVDVIPCKIAFLELIWLYPVFNIPTAVQMKNIKTNINMGIFFFERVYIIFEGGNGSQKRVICHQLNRALVCLWNVTESFQSPFKMVSWKWNDKKCGRKLKNTNWILIFDFFFKKGRERYKK